MRSRLPVVRVRGLVLSLPLFIDRLFLIPEPFRQTRSDAPINEDNTPYWSVKLFPFALDWFPVLTRLP